MTPKPLLIIAVLAGLVAGAAQAQAPLETPLQKFSYALGVQMATQMRRQGIEELDIDAMGQAIEDLYTGHGLRLSMEEMQQAAQAVADAAEKEKSEAASATRERGETFLAGNKTAEGVQVLDSGVQYKVLTEGEGRKPTPEDKVVVHYRGRLLDGTEFDSSYKRGEPTAFGVKQVIKGWQDALVAMPVGSKWEVWIPSDLAYGERGAGGRIGPHETLHFEIELIEIEGG